MTEARLLRLIEGGENIQVEFKKSTTEITKDVYDTVCSFSNRDGGVIFLGVKGDGEILGIQPPVVDRMKRDFVTSINNGQKINPPLYLQPETCVVNGRMLLIIQVPSASQVCRHHGRIFDRSYEADIDITDNADLVYQLYARKSGSYFVNKVTCFQMNDLRADLISDPFVQEGVQSVSARDRILREICSNSLAHRDYSSGYVAKFVIERDQLCTENANRSHGHGVLHLSSFEPYAKNPPISKVFREIGLADELGSGMRNTNKYTKLYSGGTPDFVEGDVFRTVIPLSPVAVEKVGPQDTTQVTTQVAILAFCKEPRSKMEIMAHCGYKNAKNFTQLYLKPLIESKRLQMTFPDKPQSRNQKYVTVQSIAPEY